MTFDHSENYSQEVLAAHLVGAGVPNDLVHHSPDEETVIVDLGEDAPAMVLGWWNSTDDDPEPIRLDWTLYGPDNEIYSTSDGDLADATRAALAFVEG